MDRLCDRPALYRCALGYGSLEKQVLRLMTDYCGPLCARCSKVCCQPVYCREALQSPFLAWVRKVHAAQTLWSSKDGWLGPRGCRLTVGRPPVCYEFICRTIVDAYPDLKARTTLAELATLLTRVGRRAKPRAHLVEVRDFTRVNWVRLEKQLAAAAQIIFQLTTAPA